MNDIQRTARLATVLVSLAVSMPASGFASDMGPPVRSDVVVASPVEGYPPECPPTAACAGGPPREIAAPVIVVMVSETPVGRPSTVDHPVEGTILRVEKGALPLGATIVFPANSWGGGAAPARVPARLYLYKFADRDTYYIAGIQPLADPNIPAVIQFLEVPPTISLLPWRGLGPDSARRSRTFSARSPLLLGVTVGGATGGVDLYVVATTPGGASGSWAAAESFVVGSEWVPLAQSAVLAATTTYVVRYVFTGSEPPGTYLLSALIVPPGSSPHDPRNWLATGVVAIEFRP
jgi:hypothetical protein